MASRPFFVGISGGTGSGKTYLSRKLSRHLGEADTGILETDAYYKDLSHLTPDQRAAVNFDHPDALEAELLHAHLTALSKGETILRPVYDFSTHTRTGRSAAVSPKPYILAEGILLLALGNIRPCLDFTIFLDVPADIRLIRRLERDRQKRGRTTHTIISQYLSQVRSMHERFVAPCRDRADLVLDMDYHPHNVARKIQAAAGEDKR